MSHKSFNKEYPIPKSQHNRRKRFRPATAYKTGHHGRLIWTIGVAVFFASSLTAHAIVNPEDLGSGSWQARCLQLKARFAANPDNDLVVEESLDLAQIGPVAFDVFGVPVGADGAESSEITNEEDEGGGTIVVKTDGVPILYASVQNQEVMSNIYEKGDGSTTAAEVELSKALFGNEVSPIELRIAGYRVAPKDFACLPETKYQDARTIELLNLKQIMIYPRESAYWVSSEGWNGYAECSHGRENNLLRFFLAKGRREIMGTVVLSQDCEVAVKDAIVSD